TLAKSRKPGLPVFLLGQPTRTVAQLVLADERLKREFPLITLPVLILHGTADKVTKPAGSQFFFDTAGSKDKTLKLSLRSSPTAHREGKRSCAEKNQRCGLRHRCRTQITKNLQVVR